MREAVRSIGLEVAKGAGRGAVGKASGLLVGKLVAGLLAAGVGGGAVATATTGSPSPAVWKQHVQTAVQSCQQGSGAGHCATAVVTRHPLAAQLPRTGQATPHPAATHAASPHPVVSAHPAPSSHPSPRPSGSPPPPTPAL